MKIKNHAELR